MDNKDEALCEIIKEKTNVQELYKYFNAILLNPSDSEAYFNRGLYYARAAQYDDAIKDFTKVIELNQNYVYAYNNRGFCYKNNGQYDNAIKDFTKAIELKPDYAYAYDNRADAYEKINKWYEQMADYKEILSMGIDVDGNTKTGIHKDVYRKFIKDIEEKLEKAETRSNMGEHKLTRERNPIKLWEQAKFKYYNKHDIVKSIYTTEEAKECVDDDTDINEDKFIKGLKDTIKKDSFPNLKSKSFLK